MKIPEFRNKAAALADGVVQGRRPGQGYLFAVLASLGTMALRLALQPIFRDRPLLILFMFPIILSAYVGGLGPGLLATGITTILAD
jgi:K+-sensing histidine kinase KdpD